MTDKVTLESGGEVLDLNEITVNGKGVEVVSGMTGLGLPPVDVQWFEGAGDGARPRSVRVQPRDLDLPLVVMTDNRSELKAKIAKIARIMSRPMTLKVWDGTDYMWCNVLRVGGGTYATGEDTNGETDWQTVVTLRAGDPYWYSSTQRAMIRPASLNDTYTLTNTGTAEAFPVWLFTGALSYLKVFNNTTGEWFEWAGTLNSGDTLTIDTKAVTVKDQLGTNRYSGLGLAPELFALVPGDNSITITMVQYTGVNRINYVPVPNFSGTTHDWTISPAGQASVSGGRLVVGVAGTYTSGTHTTTTGRKSWSGLPANTALQFRATISAPSGTADATFGPRTLYVTIDGVTKSYTVKSGETKDIAIDFTTGSSTTVDVKAVEGNSVLSGSKVQFFPIQIDNLYIGVPGPYFDGSTPANYLYTYAWTGTANASTSTESKIIATPVAPTSAVSYVPRDWMVV